MRKGTDLIGKPIIAFDTGKHLDRIEDLVFDQHTNQLLGFLVGAGAWRAGARVVPLGGVQAIGPDAVIVPSGVVIVEPARVPEIQRILELGDALSGKKIYTTDGRDLGTMVDLYFDDRTGRIEGYEVTGGIFGDPETGHAFVPAPESITLGQDVAFVPPEVALAMEERLEAGGSELPATDVLALGAAESAGDPRSSETQVLVSSEPHAEHQGHAVVGRRTQRMVRTPTGAIVAAPGQIVTPAVVDRARELHCEEQLRDSVSATPGGPELAGARSADRPGDGTRIRVSSLWDQVKRRVDAYRGRAGEEIEAQRIRRALGRPVTRVILDENDDVILDVGEVVTHGAVERARAAGALDILLDSVVDDQRRRAG